VKRSILRRFVLPGLAGLIIIALGSAWLTFSHPSWTGITSTAPAGVITEFSIPTSKSTPGEIIAGTDGNLWFNENSGNKIGRISTNGTITQFAIPTPNSVPRGITIGTDGNLWFTQKVPISSGSNTFSAHIDRH